MSKIEYQKNVYVEKAPPADIQPDEVLLPLDENFVECQNIFSAILGKTATVVEEIYTTHPEWGAIYRAKYIPKEIDHDQDVVLICWRIAKGIAVSPWNQCSHVGDSGDSGF